MFSQKINVQLNGLLFVPSIFLLQWQDYHLIATTTIRLMVNCLINCPSHELARIVVLKPLLSRYYKHFQNSVMLGAYLKWDYWKIKLIHGWPLHQTEWQLWASCQRKVITTRWPFFTATRRHAIEETESGFPSCNIFKTSFQVLYNSLKGGLDANTEQVASITPGVKVRFKQKYVLRLITALVTNA
jgi:hypothetical protein